MLKYFLYAYLQGYRDGLQGCPDGLHGMYASAAMSAGLNKHRTDRVFRSNLTNRPAYRAGFLAGCKDRFTFVQTRSRNV
jgi:hypothetical protein